MPHRANLNRRSEDGLHCAAGNLPVLQEYEITKYVSMPFLKKGVAKRLRRHGLS
ncbi:hypothetical protein KsCSTR_07440 [Candidatus Kuenenia stuttgartiensis]|uniref:Uncharacterized protein n=1 Tax=Kuenenia stuttgartiensis TaxID=174633 RepID=A0A6G7GLD3_KUEST|nr:hypothetical protein KsCSTR_07440 [Candidatus Kuenenia stuttgartiensis]